jgi:HD-like signal output (HDOD) protein
MDAPPDFETSPFSGAIVMVDDGGADGASLIRCLSAEGHTLYTYRDPSDALKQIQQHAADMVITPLRTAPMNGLQVLNRAADIRPETLRVLMVGSEDRPVAAHAIAKGLVHTAVELPWSGEGYRSLLAAAFRAQQELRTSHLSQLLAHPDRLPSPPKFHVRLRSLLARDTSSVQLISDEIRQDPVLVGKLLRIANSVYYGARTSITNVRDAVVFIGTDSIASLVMAIEAFSSVLNAPDERAIRVIDLLWHQAMRRAAVAKMIAGRWSGFKDPGLAYTASLLQDLGYVVRLAYDPGAFFRFYRLVFTGAMSMEEADADIFPVSHAEVGAVLFRFWNLPPDIVRAVEWHHGPSHDDSLTQIAQIAMVLESAEGSVPHDLSLDPVIIAWAEKLNISLPKGFAVPAEPQPTAQPAA